MTLSESQKLGIADIIDQAYFTPSVFHRIVVLSASQIGQVLQPTALSKSGCWWCLGQSVSSSSFIGYMHSGNIDICSDIRSAIRRKRQSLGRPSSSDVPSRPELLGLDASAYMGRYPSMPKQTRPLVVKSCGVRYRR